MDNEPIWLGHQPECVTLCEERGAGHLISGRGFGSNSNFTPALGRCEASPGRCHPNGLRRLHTRILHPQPAQQLCFMAPAGLVLTYYDCDTG